MTFRNICVAMIIKPMAMHIIPYVWPGLSPYFWSLRVAASRSRIFGLQTQSLENKNLQIKQCSVSGCHVNARGRSVRYFLELLQSLKGSSVYEKLKQK